MKNICFVFYIKRKLKQKFKFNKTHSKINEPWEQNRYLRPDKHSYILKPIAETMRKICSEAVFLSNSWAWRVPTISILLLIPTPRLIYTEFEQVEHVTQFKTWHCVLVWTYLINVKNVLSFNVWLWKIDSFNLLSQKLFKFFYFFF